MLNISKACTGCMACASICPVDAVSTVIDRYGYVMPSIDPAVCTDCGLCEKVCPLEVPVIPETYPLSAFSAFHISDEVVRISSSGGVFYALAQEVLRSGGIVYGCYYDPARREARLEDTDHLSLEQLLTSKYVESYTGRKYRQIRECLESGRLVLFCGTPCQAAGLKAFLRKEYRNLLLVDFACGAVSADGYLRDYLELLEKKEHSPVIDIRFRDKYYGWGQYCMTAEFENGRLYRKTAMSDPYFFCFLRSSMQRLSCHGCRFSDAHQSDLCLSDFWKCDSFDVDRNGRRGLSLVLVYTDRGMEWLKAAAGQLHLEKIHVEDASYHLRKRICPDSKLPEIRAHMLCARNEGVSVLRKRLLSPRQRIRFALRQFVMDRPVLARIFPKLVGRGQIMKP